MNARTAAFFALSAYEERGIFFEVALQLYKKELTNQDFALAYELGSGVIRMRRFLDFLATAYAEALPKKKKERILLRMSLYQAYFCTKIPLHAIGKEMVELAKAHTSTFFARFLNAQIRKMDRQIVPECRDLGVKYSYSDYFVQSLVHPYGEKEAERILKRQNEPVPIMARVRKCPDTVPEGTQKKEDMLVIEKGTPLESIVQSKNYYIQNITQQTLIKKLAEKLSGTPHSILDLCAAPGGKTILCKDLFPEAELYANDISEEKIARIKENLQKYGLEAHLSVSRGEEVIFAKKFDLILVDAPCTNSGVLYKCPEARWRITEEAVVELQKTSLALLKNAKAHLADGGRIWFLTCSILPQENEELVKQAEKLGLMEEAHFLELPHEEYEGGFGCVLRNACE